MKEHQTSAGHVTKRRRLRLRVTAHVPRTLLQALSHAVFGVAISTLDGIRAVLAATGCANDKDAPVQWYNMREEPCIYIGGRPFVLREATRPLANLRECALHAPLSHMLPAPRAVVQHGVRVGAC